MSPFNAVLLYCRAGFEKECAAEAADLFNAAGVFGYPQPQTDQGYVVYHCTEANTALKVFESIDFRNLIFIRQWLAVAPVLKDLSPKDRITPVIDALEGFPECAEVWVEPADTTDGRELAGFCKKFSGALAQQLRRSGQLLPKGSRAQYRLHLFVISGTHFYVGVAPVRNSSRWPMGIQRLKFPKDAPSRSTLKLEEAWHWFVPKREWDERLGGGKWGADLGAAPGGWTWQLVNQHMRVYAVDNGPMSPDLMETGQVDHRVEDAFTFVPPKPLDWMVCDIVDKPARVTNMILRWVEHGWAKEMIFNLKLPMKQRYQEAVKCLNLIHEVLTEHDVKYSLRARHLYHDREEITCHLDLRR